MLLGTIKYDYQYNTGIFTCLEALRAIVLSDHVYISSFSLQSFFDDLSFFCMQRSFCSIDILSLEYNDEVSATIEKEYERKL